MAYVPRWLTPAVLLVTCVGVGDPSRAEVLQHDAPDWHDVKCARYRKAWAAALVHQGSEGLGQSFLRSHAAFLDSNCTRRADVCARSPAELRLANTMVVLSMNAGAASTFAPFYCR